MMDIENRFVTTAKRILDSLGASTRLQKTLMWYPIESSQDQHPIESSQDYSCSTPQNRHRALSKNSTFTQAKPSQIKRIQESNLKRQIARHGDEEKTDVAETSKTSKYPRTRKTIKVSQLKSVVSSTHMVNDGIPSQYASNSDMLYYICMCTTT